MLVVMEGGHPWGFRIEGGAEIRGPLRINKVTFHFYFAPCNNPSDWCTVGGELWRSSHKTDQITLFWLSLSKCCILSGLLRMFLKDSTRA